MFSKRTLYTTLLTLLLVLTLATGCRSGKPVSPTQPPSAVAGQSTLASAPPQNPLETPAAQAITVAPTPTLTPEPLALRINGDGISVAEYQVELRQLQDAQQALGQNATPEQQRQQVLDNLTDTLLLAQGAFENGFKLDDAALQAEIDNLAQQRGGADALQAWVTAQGYTDAAFRASLRRQLAAAWQRDRIAGAVPAEAEQVHARQILTIDEDIANKALEQVKIPGANFAAYAYRYDSQTGGDLGWFPRGYLTQPEVESAAFALQPGEMSPVVKSGIGYHIIQVIAREPSRAISPDARRVLQHKALQDWLSARREATKVEILLP